MKIGTIIGLFVGVVLFLIVSVVILAGINSFIYMNKINN